MLTQFNAQEPRTEKFPFTSTVIVGWRKEYLVRILYTFTS